MAQELLIAKGDIGDLGVNWVSRFLDRHPELRSRYVPPLDKERALAKKPDIVQGWSDLFLYTKQKYDIQDCDIYNIDEKGAMIGVTAKIRVIVSRREKRQFMIQCSNRE